MKLLQAFNFSLGNVVTHIGYKKAGFPRFDVRFRRAQSLEHTLHTDIPCCYILHVRSHASLSLHCMRRLCATRKMWCLAVYACVCMWYAVCCRKCVMIDIVRKQPSDFIACVARALLSSVDVQPSMEQKRITASRRS